MLTSHVLAAARRLVDLDEKQVNAVAARIELDLRIGYAFTRFITNSLRTLRGPMEGLVISYGTHIVISLFTSPNPCQDPVNSRPWASWSIVTFV